MSLEVAMSRSLDEKLEFFSTKVPVHPRLSWALDEVDYASTPHSGSEIIMLIGPAGVGKSTLIKALKNRVIARHKADARKDPGYIPIVAIEAASSGDKAFSWKSFLSLICQQLGGHIGSTIVGMQQSIQNALVHRRTKMVVIDEAFHILKNSNDRTLQNHLTMIRNLVGGSGASLVLVGAYDLHQAINRDGQTARRTKIIHFQHYKSGIEEDEVAFRTVLRQLAGQIPMENVPDLDPLADEIHHVCAGCVGILKDTLSRSIGEAHKEGPIWSIGHLLRAALTPAQLDTILREITDGEARLEHGGYASGADTAYENLRRKAAILLGMDK